MNACAIVDSAWPTLSVPGISLTGTMLRSLKIAVLVANDPMPSVSRNAVTKPTPTWNGVGTARPPRTTMTTQTSSMIARPANRNVLASMHQVVGIGLRQIDRRPAHLGHRGGEQGADRGRSISGHHSVRREHRHRALQRLDVERVVFAAQRFRRPLGDLLRRVLMHPVEGAHDCAREA